MVQAYLPPYGALSASSLIYIAIVQRYAANFLERVAKCTVSLLFEKIKPFSLDDDYDYKSILIYIEVSITT